VTEASQPDGGDTRLHDVELVLGWEAPVVEFGVDAAVPADAVFREHYAPLAGWCRKMTGDSEVAHDVAAEAFARLLARWSRVEDPRAYLYTTALNLIRDRWRRSERERTALRRHRTTTPVTTPAATPELRMLVEALPRRHQQVIVLHYFADLPIAQVAAALGVAVGTVKRDLFDARATLGRLLEESS
jgi:RNA polymerase sigma-70 factor (ECF subfamily)